MNSKMVIISLKNHQLTPILNDTELVNEGGMGRQLIEKHLQIDNYGDQHKPMLN